VRGVTLPEVLVALVVLAVGLIGLASAATSASRLAVRGRWDAEAAALAARRIEVLRRQGCRGASSGEESVGPLAVAWALGGGADARYLRVYVSITRSAALGGGVTAFADVIPC